MKPPSGSLKLIQHFVLFYMLYITGTQCWLTSTKSSELQMGCSWILQSKMLKTWWNLLPKSGGTWFLDQSLFRSIICVPCHWFSIHYSTVVLHHWLISQVELAEPQMEPTHGHTCLSPRPQKNPLKSTWIKDAKNHHYVWGNAWSWPLVLV